MEASLVQFRTSEGGGATVDFVVLTAAVILLSVAVMAGIAQGARTAAQDVSVAMTGPPAVAPGVQDDGSGATAGTEGQLAAAAEAPLLETPVAGDAPAAEVAAEPAADTAEEFATVEAADTGRPGRGPGARNDAGRRDETTPGLGQGIGGGRVLRPEDTPGAGAYSGLDDDRGGGAGRSR